MSCLVGQERACQEMKRSSKIRFSRLPAISRPSPARVFRSRSVKSPSSEESRGNSPSFAPKRITAFLPVTRIRSAPPICTLSSVWGIRPKLHPAAQTEKESRNSRMVMGCPASIRSITSKRSITLLHVRF